MGKPFIFLKIFILIFFQKYTINIEQQLTGKVMRHRDGDSDP
jgi:hypothetical protein